MRSLWIPKEMQVAPRLAEGQEAETFARTTPS